MREFFLLWVLGQDLSGTVVVQSTKGEEYLSNTNGNDAQKGHLALTEHMIQTIDKHLDSAYQKNHERQPEIDSTRAKLVALIEHMDDGIGRVLSALKQHGFHDQTLVLCVSDNGGQLNVEANNGSLCERERDGL